jgi:membrane protein
MWTWREKLEDGLFIKSRGMHGLGGTLLRLLRFPAALARDWLSGELNMRAMSLVYTTLLSLVPLIAFSFSVLKGLGAHGDLRPLVFEFFRPMGAAADQLTDRVMQFVGNVRGGVLGSIGLAFLIYTVITTIQKVEESFNFVWRVDRPRSLAKRLSEYLSVMLVGPVLMVAALGLIASAQNTQLAAWISGIQPLGQAFSGLASLGPYVLVTIVFTFMYSFVPNTQVRFIPALIGGLSAGVLWAVLGKAFATFIVYSAQMMAIYTGFAIVLTALIWVYLNWLILLIGAQLSFYVQYPQYLRHGHEPVELSGSMREQVALSAMYLIGREYAKGANHWTANALAAELDIPGVALSPVLQYLEKSGLIIATEGENLLPARAMENIRLMEILDAVRCTQPGRLSIAARNVPAAQAAMLSVSTALQEGVGETTLRDLVAGDCHFLDENRAHPHPAADIDVVAHGDDATQHVL